MHHSSRALIVWAIPALVSSLVVLHLAAVGRLVWIAHLIAIGLAGILAWSVGRLGRLQNRSDQLPDVWPLRFADESVRQRKVEN
jgi:Flp pilus assembly protein TadB